MNLSNLTQNILYKPRSLPESLVLNGLVFAVITMFLAEASYILYQTNGENLSYSVIYYIPIIIAAIFFDLLGGLSMALICALLFGYLVPSADVNSFADPHENITLRLSFFGVVGMIVGASSTILKRNIVTYYDKLCHNEISGALNYNGLVRKFYRLDKNKEYYFLMIDIRSFFKYLSMDHSLLRGLIKAVIKSLEKTSPLEMLAHIDFTKFCIVVAKNDMVKLEELKNAITKTLEQPYSYVAESEDGSQNSYSIYLDFTLGASVYNAENNDLFFVLRNAEMSATNTPASINEPSISRYVQNFKDKVASEQLYHYYKPIFTLNTKQLAGFKAQLQYDESHSFPLTNLESFDIMHDLTSAMVKDAIKQLCYIEQPISIYINLSPYLLRDTSFMKDILSNLRAKGFKAEAISFMTSATSFLNQIKHYSDIDELKGLGIRLVICDTGINTIPELLKYKGLISEVELAENNSEKTDDMIAAETALLKEYINILHANQITIMSPPVSDQKELKYYQELKCDLAQWRLIGKPLASHQTAAFAKNFQLAL